MQHDFAIPVRTGHVNGRAVATVRKIEAASLEHSTRAEFWMSTRPRRRMQARHLANLGGASGVERTSLCLSLDPAANLTGTYLVFDGGRQCGQRGTP